MFKRRNPNPREPEGKQQNYPALGIAMGVASAPESALRWIIWRWASPSASRSVRVLVRHWPEGRSEMLASGAAGAGDKAESRSIMRRQRRSGLQRGWSSAAVLGVLLLGSCMTRTQQYSFEVRSGSTVEERLEKAKALATEDRLARLKQELTSRHRDLTDAQLSRIGIRWNERWSVGADGSRTDGSVLITVLMEEQPGADTGAVIMTAARILDAEINGPEHHAIESESVQ